MLTNIILVLIFLPAKVTPVTFNGLAVLMRVPGESFSFGESTTEHGNENRG
jgi:hypothetical protein